VVSLGSGLTTWQVSSVDRTCSWNLVRSLPLASFSTEHVAGWSVSLVSNPTNYPGRTREVALRLGTEGTIILR
jgi:hypothetical protein